MDERALRAMCRRLLRDLGLRRPVSASRLCEALGRHRGRPIVVVSRDLPGGGTFGALVPMPDRDLLVVQARMSPQHRQTVVYHEIVHLVRSHAGAPGTGRALCGGRLPGVGATATGGTFYDHWQEWEAETGAAILAGWSSPADAADEPVTPAERAIARALGAGGR